MINFLIDASVLAVPQPKENPERTFNEYLKNINMICNLINDEAVNSYINNEDISLLNRHNLLFNDHNKINLKIEKYDKKRIADNFTDLIRKYDLLNVKGNTNDCNKYILFEKNYPFKIKNIEDINDEDIIFPEEYELQLNNNWDNNCCNEIKKHSKKNVIKSIILNDIIFTDENNKLELIMNLSENEVSCNIKNRIKIKFNIKDKKNDLLSEIRYCIPSLQSNYLCNPSKIKINNFDSIQSKYNYLKKYCNEIYTSFLNAKKEFSEWLIFNPATENSMREYIDLIEIKNKDRKPFTEERISIKLYSYLKILYLFSKSINTDIWQNTDIDESDGYCCRPCTLIESCKSRIKLLGADCVDENKEQLKDINVKAERTRGENNSVFSLHLRPFNRKCQSNDWYKSLRIHFNWNYQEKKIEIGWIGRHLYLPCKERYNFSKCERPSCPINPKSPYHDPDKDEYANFLKKFENP